MDSLVIDIWQGRAERLVTVDRRNGWSSVPNYWHRIFLCHPSMTLIWFWKAKRKRGSKKEIILLYFLFQHIGFSRAAVRTSLVRALQPTRQVSIWNIDLPPALGGAWSRWIPPALHESVFKAASTGEKDRLAWHQGAHYERCMDYEKWRPQLLSAEQALGKHIGGEGATL